MEKLTIIGEFTTHSDNDMSQVTELITNTIKASGATHIRSDTWFLLGGNITLVWADGTSEEAWEAYNREDN